MCDLKKQNEYGGSPNVTDNPLVNRVSKVHPASNTENKHWIRNASKNGHNTAAFFSSSPFCKHNCQKFKIATYNLADTC